MKIWKKMQISENSLQNYVNETVAVKICESTRTTSEADLRDKITVYILFTRFGE